jgi:hypothetical protein
VTTGDRNNQPRYVTLSSPEGNKLNDDRPDFLPTIHRFRDNRDEDSASSDSKFWPSDVSPDSNPSRRIGKEIELMFRTSRESLQDEIEGTALWTFFQPRSVKQPAEMRRI